MKRHRYHPRVMVRGVPPRTDGALALAVDHHRAGRLKLAEGLYREVLQAEPNNPDALHLLGVLAHQVGDHVEAAELIGRALFAHPEAAEFHNNLGNALWGQGRIAEAEASYRRALALAPDYAEAHANLGNVLWAEDRAVEAEASCRRAIELRPEHAQAHTNLGNALAAQGKVEEAEASYRRAVALAPGLAEAHNNLGAALSSLGRFAEAETHCRRALALRPDYPEACNNVGSALWMQGQPEEAIAHYRRAIAVRPDYPDAHSNLGQVLTAAGQHAEAEASCRRALELRPDYAEAHANLGNALVAQGDLAAAVASFERAVALKPDYAVAHSNIIFALDFDPRTTSRRAFDERRRWNALHAAPLASDIVRHDNDPSPERRLRIGYVSADFRRHSAATVFAPVVLGHDRDRFEVVCYSGVIQPDDHTARFRDAASLWRSTVGVSDARLAEIIREDAIDILVDLSGHSAGHRLLVFARKPAPVQVTAWGHALGTGLDAIDCFFADRVIVPTERRGDFTEEVIDLPVFVAYDPPAPSPEVAPLPALTEGRVTFGSFNRPAKVTDQMLVLWAAILAEMPGSRLLLKFIGLDDPANQARIVTALGARGIAADRVAFLGGSRSWDHLDAYRLVDVALDAFPHGGGVTALDGLWMGVPMVTLLGERVPGRMGASFLGVLGLEDFIATTPDAYVDIACRHARALSRLARLRLELRDRMRVSPLCDHAAYCRAVEEAYRSMWKRWCARSGGEPSGEMVEN